MSTVTDMPIPVSFTLVSLRLTYSPPLFKLTFNNDSTSRSSVHYNRILCFGILSSSVRLVAAVSKSSSTLVNLTESFLKLTGHLIVLIVSVGAGGYTKPPSLSACLCISIALVTSLLAPIMKSIGYTTPAS